MALAQGSEFTDNVVVHFPDHLHDRAFGHAYVALSRVKDINKLFVAGLLPSHVKADPSMLA